MKKQDDTNSNQAYYVDSEGKTHNLGIRDLMYLPDLKLKAPEIEESVDKFGNMSWRSTFTIKVARPDQLISLGIDLGEPGGDRSVTTDTKITEEMDF